jgi:tetratricopeptide (TPR) repeat protein
VTVKCPECHSENPDTKQFCGDCGIQLISTTETEPSFTKTLDAPSQELTRGSLFAGRYEIIEELGKGGMGKVYKVLDTQIKEEMALVFLEKKSGTELQEATEELKELIDRSTNKKSIRYYFHLLGKIELEKANYSQAIEHFRNAVELLPYQKHWY